MTVTIPVTTLCPCSKAISAYGAHNQRGYVTLALRSVKAIWIEDMISDVYKRQAPPRERVGFGVYPLLAS